MSKEGSKTLWRGVRPTDPESIFTRHEAPDGTTLVNKFGIIDNGNLTLYTVAADKVLYITDFGLSVYPSGAAGYGAITLLDGGSVVLAHLAWLDCDANIGQSVMSNLSIGWKCVEDEYIRIKSQAANVSVYGWFTGYTRNV